MSDSDVDVPGLARGPFPPDDDVVDVPAVAPVRRRRTRNARGRNPRSGRFGAWILGKPAQELPEDLAAGGDPAAGRRRVLGLAECGWEVEPSTPALEVSHASLSGGRRRGSDSWAFLLYKVHEAWELDEVVPLDDSASLHGPLAMRALVDACDGRQFRGREGSVRDAVAELGVRVVGAFCFPIAFAMGIFSGARPYLVRSVALAARFSPAQIIPGHPATFLLRRLRIDAGGSCAQRRERRRRGLDDAEFERAYNEVLLELPKRSRGHEGASHADDISRSKRDLDPLKMLRALAFSQYLKTPKTFSLAMGAAHAIDNPLAAPRDPTRDPSRSSLERALCRMDIVDILVERRHFHADRIFDRIDFIGFYSDSSPVTGEEIQGMLLDVILKDETHRRVTLPGASLPYGLFGSIMKSVTLLWACWLVAGPFFEHMSYFYSKCRCITTDGGAEIKTLDLPDVLKAFLKWNAGARLEDCRGLVDHSRRLLYNSLRVSGWSHCWGNLMKDLVKVCTKWPRFNEQLNMLVNFIRNASWRKFLAGALVPAGVDKKLFDHPPPPPLRRQNGDSRRTRWLYGAF